MTDIQNNTIRKFVTIAWSPELAYSGGVMAANDWRAVGANTALTPGANVHRLPINGRNWEYVSGEDALLGRLKLDSVGEKKIITRHIGWQFRERPAKPGTHGQPQALRPQQPGAEPRGGDRKDR